MTQPAPVPTPPPGDPAPAPTEPAAPSAPAEDKPLGPAGERALATEREARKALEKQLAELAPHRGRPGQKPHRRPGRVATGRHAGGAPRLRRPAARRVPGRTGRAPHPGAGPVAGRPRWPARPGPRGADRRGPHGGRLPQGHLAGALEARSDSTTHLDRRAGAGRAPDPLKGAVSYGWHFRARYHL
jgi:hypothetical protein